jgi:hypothetical protein
MIGHAIYLKQFMIVLLEDRGNILVQSFFPFGTDKRFAILHREYKMNMDLGIGICHEALVYLYAI